jgi:hypothetical protein
VTCGVQISIPEEAFHSLFQVQQSIAKRGVYVLGKYDRQNCGLQDQGLAQDLGVRGPEAAVSTPQSLTNLPNPRQYKL